MSYDYDIFISYRRSPTVGAWVKNHLMPRLDARLNDIAPRPVRISCDLQIADGAHWPDDLKHRIRTSGLLLAIWSADYFRSSWCMAEWDSFKERETQLRGMGKLSQKMGLVLPVRYADGDHYHPDAKVVQCKQDFTRLNHPDVVFSQSAKYIEFDEAVQGLAEAVLGRMSDLPDWRSDFPLSEPAAMPPVTIPRSTL